MISIQALLNAPTSVTVRARLVTMLIALGIPANQWRSGGVASSILTVVARTFAGFASTVTNALSAAFLGVASGPWLALLAFYVFGVTPNPATFANGPIVLTNAGGGIYSFPAGGVTIVNPVTGQAYVSTQALTLAAFGTAVIAFQATTAGSVGSSAAGAITKLVTTMVGVSATNPAPLVGQDADTDPQIVAKCIAARAARSYLGPEGAYENAIFTAVNAQGNPLNINRVSVVNTSDMAVTVYVASPQGVPTAGDIAIAQEAVLQIAQPMDVTATVVACTPVTYSPFVTLWAQAGSLPPLILFEQATRAILAYVALFPISGLPVPPSSQGFMYATAITGVLRGVHPLIYDVQGVTADVPLNAGQVLVWNGTIIVRQLGTG